MKRIFVLILFSCVPTINFGQCTKEGKTVSRHEYITEANRQSIKGTWSHEKWTSYQILQFSDSTVYLYNNIDTIMPSKYSVSGDTLTIWAGQPAKPYRNKILSLTNDTLVLQGIIDVKDIIGYSRKKKQNNKQTRK